jgi:hypothetical protein
VKNRPEPGLANTGDYLDGFGNKVSVYAIGNPAKKNRRGLVLTAHDKASGHGMVRIDQKERTYTMECWRLLFDAANPRKDDQFPGWPRTVDMYDNYGRKPVAHLPLISVAGADNPVIQVVNDQSGCIEYTVRMNGSSFKPGVFSESAHTVRIEDTESGRVKVIEGMMPGSGTVEVSL